MKDIDFDELDRAVSSILGDADTPDGASQPSGQTVSPSAVSIPEPSADTSQPDAAKPVAAKRSAGRFMDVMHPSSDMKTTASADTPVSRQGATIAQPVSSMETSDTPELVITEPKVGEPTLGATEVPDGRLPDPIDFLSAQQGTTSGDQPSETGPETSNKKQDEPQFVTDESSVPEEITSETPFLSDPKVQKRPLGAFSIGDATGPTDDAAKEGLSIDSKSAQPEEQLAGDQEPPVADTTSAESTVSAEIAEPANDSTAADKDISQPDDPQTLAEPTESAVMPEELQDDLLSIESDTTTKPHINVDDIAGPAGSPVAGSIAQQYQEQPATAEQPAGAIYDVEAYHQPLKHPAKKKSGWLVVLLIVVLILIGVGAGAAVYYFMW